MASTVLQISKKQYGTGHYFLNGDNAELYEKEQENHATLNQLQ